jgi:pyruvate kinase
MRKEIWCTLGPASLNERVIKRLEEVGVSLFRLNLSHTKLVDVASRLAYIQSQTRIPICLDTEGAQVRTGALINGDIILPDSSIMHIPCAIVAGDTHAFNLYPEGIVTKLVVGDLLKIDADVLAQVIAIDSDGAIIQILNGGKIGQNKAVTILEREIDMPPLTQKDRQALTIGMEMGIRHVALSFANRSEDVDEIRLLSRAGTMIISKIECLNGLMNLVEIADKSDALLIDRGDLSRQVNLEQMPALQKLIIRYAKEAGIKIYVATNLMESMVTMPSPTRAEVNDVFNTLMDGADGLVLAAETAIGAYPVGTASMVRKIIREFEDRNTFRWQRTQYNVPPLSSLTEPHGGTLVNRVAYETSPQQWRKLQVVKVCWTDLMDCAQIAQGTYSPLTGFMTSEELDSVLNTNQLPGGVAWTMPILLQTTTEAIRGVTEGDLIALGGPDGVVYATLEVREIFSLRFNEVAQKWFGTTSVKHPGVARLLAGGTQILAGPITLINKPPATFPHYEHTPSQTRLIFAQKGWSKVIGFHTRNVPHRAHEYIQLQALESVHADGLYISPVIGPKKSGDFVETIVLKSYQLLIDHGIYPTGQVVLGAFATYPRYCGPREAVFTALCRKNMGCSHFIVGRDHTGVDGFYRDDQIRDLFESLDNLDITPIFFDRVGYDPTTQSYSTLPAPQVLSISGKQMREALLNHDSLPSWFMHDVIQDFLRKSLDSKEQVFFK